jgi:DnaJ family protein A protein 5
MPPSDSPVLGPVHTPLSTRPSTPEAPSIEATEDGSHITEISKRDRRRQRESKKKAEEEAHQAEMKEARKAAKKAKPVPDTLLQQNAKLSRNGPARGVKLDSLEQQDAKLNKSSKGKGKIPGKGKGKEKVAAEEELGQEKVDKVIEGINEKRTKLVEKWGDDWTSESLQVE